MTMGLSSVGKLKAHQMAHQHFSGDTQSPLTFQVTVTKAHDTLEELPELSVLTNTIGFKSTTLPLLAFQLLSMVLGSHHMILKMWSTGSLIHAGKFRQLIFPASSVPLSFSSCIHISVVFNPKIQKLLLQGWRCQGIHLEPQ